MSELTNALRAVIETARQYAKVGEPGDALEDASENLEVAVANLERILPAESAGFIVRRMWQEQEPGNWVSPEGSTEWFRIVDVVPFTNPDGTVDVTIDLRGQEFKAPRKATDKVRTRTKTRRTVTEDAIELLAKELGGEVIS